MPFSVRQTERENVLLRTRILMYVTVVTLQALSYDVHERPSTSR